MGKTQLEDLKNAFVGHCRELKCEEDYIKVCENKFDKIENELEKYKEKTEELETIASLIIDIFNYGAFVKNGAFIIHTDDLCLRFDIGISGFSANGLHYYFRDYKKTWAIRKEDLEK